MYNHKFLDNIDVPQGKYSTRHFNQNNIQFTFYRDESNELLCKTTSHCIVMCVFVGLKLKVVWVLFKKRGKLVTSICVVYLASHDVEWMICEWKS